MIVYTKTCLPCTHRKKFNELKKYARDRGEVLEQRRITHNPEWKIEADRYDVALPFIVYGKQALSLNEPLERLEIK